MERAAEGVAMPKQRTWSERLSVAQGVFYAATGIWPLLDIASFERVTGPKTDRWLVKTVGALVSVVGLSLASAGLKRRVGPDIALLAAGAALAFTAVDLVYSASGRISKVYLADAAAEAALVGGWAAATTTAHA